MGLVVVPIPEQMAQTFDIDLYVVQRTRIEMWNQSRMCVTGLPAAVPTRAGSAGSPSLITVTG